MRLALRAPVLGLLLALGSATKADTVWDFDTPSDAQGWEALNGVLSLAVRDGALELELDPTDPYIWSGPESLDLPTDGFSSLEVRMRSDAYGAVQVYWTTAESPEWYGPDHKRLAGKVIGDGSWHTIRVRLDQHPGWRGRLTHVRLDPIETLVRESDRVHVAIDRIRLVTPDPAGAWRLDIAEPVATTGRPFSLYCRLYNGGSRPLTGMRAHTDPCLPAAESGDSPRPPRATAPGQSPFSAGLVLADGRADTPFPEVAPSTGAVIAVPMVAQRSGVYRARVTAQGPDGRQGAAERVVQVCDPAPQALGRAGAPRVRELPQALLLENDRVRLTFIRGPQGFGRIAWALFDERRREWADMGVCRSFSRLVAGRGPADVPIYAARWRKELRTDGGRGLQFASHATDGDGVTWTFSFAFSLAPEADRVSVEYVATPSADADCYLLDGPNLYVGEGTFGSHKDVGLLPGLEFLQGDQDSSSLRDFSNEWRFRMAPHPYRLTIPVASVAHDGCMVALSWDPLRKWDGAESFVGLRYASPNRIADWAQWTEYGDNHLLGLFVPSVPRWVPENAMQAEEPYRAIGGRPLTIGAEVLLASSDDPVFPVLDWIERHRLPEPAPAPRSGEDEDDLCRQAYLRTLWSPEAAGWKQWVEVDEYRKNAWVELLLTLDVLTTDRPEVRRALEERVRTAHEGRPPGPAGRDATGSVVPYFLGELDTDTLSTLEARVREALASQSADGSWAYVPLPLPEGFEDSQPLGDASHVSTYRTAANAWVLLRYASITGDSAAREGGLRALAFLIGGRCLVPQGAPFEDPAESPYLLTSGLAVGAFVEGWKLTHDRGLLRGARYWAASGLPFVYLWNLPDTPVQRYATLGVFGSSYWDHASWLGRPVQWIGLDYAYNLRKLAEVDDSFPWRTVADGITTSAMYQQSTEGPRLGTYPDSLEGAGDLSSPGFRHPYGVWIQPDLIMINLLTGRGLDPDINTRIVALPSGHDLHIASAGRIEGVAVSGDVEMRLQYWPCRPFGTTVAGLGPPNHVETERGELHRADRLADVAEGWAYDAARGVVCIKVQANGNRTRLRIRPPAGR